jgi:hypothetical protein
LRRCPGTDAAPQGAARGSSDQATDQRHGDGRSQKQPQLDQVRIDPGSAGIGGLAGGTGLVEAKGLGHDGHRGLQNELAQGGNPGLAERELKLAQSPAATG